MSRGLLCVGGRLAAGVAQAQVNHNNAVMLQSGPVSAR